MKVEELARVDATKEIVLLELAIELNEEETTTGPLLGGMPGDKDFKMKISEEFRQVVPTQRFDELTRFGMFLSVERSELSKQSEPIQCWLELTIDGNALIRETSVEFKQSPELQKYFC